MKRRGRLRRLREISSHKRLIPQLERLNLSDIVCPSLTKRR